METFITLKTFNAPFESHLLRARLEAEGIYCFLKDEHQVGMNPIYNQAYGGIKLQVAQKDVADALEVIKAYEADLVAPENQPEKRENSLTQKVLIAIFIILSVLFCIGGK
jgi:Putative prokaryotic signal transducing protein